MREAQFSGIEALDRSANKLCWIQDPLAVVILSPGSKARPPFLSLVAFRLLYGYYGERKRACGWYTKLRQVHYS